MDTVWPEGSVNLEEKKKQKKNSVVLHKLYKFLVEQPKVGLWPQDQQPHT